MLFEVVAIPAKLVIFGATEGVWLLLRLLILLLFFWRSINGGKICIHCWGTDLKLCSAAD